MTEMKLISDFDSMWENDTIKNISIAKSLGR